MTLTKRYMATFKNIDAIFHKIVEGVAPAKFTLEHLQGIGFKSSSDRAIIPLMKDLGFLFADGTPTPRYLAYRNAAQSKAVMAEALREAYGDLFTINEHPTEKDRPAIQGKFKSAHNTTDRVAEFQAGTFLALLRLADLNAAPGVPMASGESTPIPATPDTRALIPFKPDSETPTVGKTQLGLSYTIEIHLPATTDIAVYNAVFKSLKEHLLA